MNPLDYIYRSIGCKIQPLNENEHETQYILTYINASGRYTQHWWGLGGGCPLELSMTAAAGLVVGGLSFKRDMLLELGSLGGACSPVLTGVWLENVGVA